MRYILAGRSPLVEFPTLGIHRLSLVLLCDLCIMLVCKDVISQLPSPAFYSAACFPAMMASYLPRTGVTLNCFCFHGKRKVMNTCYISEMTFGSDASSKTILRQNLEVTLWNLHPQNHFYL